MIQNIGEYLESRIQRTADDCWIWTGPRDRDGYGHAFWPTETREQSRHRAHRLAYRALVGEIPAGKVLDHLCGHRACVNPAHLEPVTVRENNRRSPRVASTINAAKIACPAGHAYDSENTYVDRRYGRRGCKICRRERNREWMRRHYVPRPTIAAPVHVQDRKVEGW